ncbi:MAG: HlyC/CorC family transporter [Lachnospiraceae bacterium]|nr:HlyC/CorC family transporter [Lachnospiraceae bacterium]
MTETAALILVLAGILLCILLSNFFSASEMAFSSCSHLRLESERENGSSKNRKAAGKALYIIEHFDDALSSILIGNNLVNIAASSLGSVAVVLIFGNDSLTWVSTLVLTILVIVFGETIPKITSKKGANRYAMANAGAVRLLMTLLRPLVWLTVSLVNLLTRPLKGEQIRTDEDEAVEELQSIIETAEDEDVLEEEQSELVQAAIDFADVSASEAMTARVDVYGVDAEDDWEEIKIRLENAHFSRIPVYKGSIDEIVGVLYMNHLLKALTEDRQPDLMKLIMKPCYVYKTMRMPEVLEALRKAKQHMAVVVDEYGGTLGIITMEDVLEQMVGEIWDETDQVETEVEKRSESEYQIDGDLPIGDLLDMLEIREEDFDFESETVGGWCIEFLGRFPTAGDSFTYEDFTMTVLRMDGLRVEKVLCQLHDEKGINV